MTETELNALRPALEAELTRLNTRAAAIRVLLGQENGSEPMEERGGRGRVRGAPAKRHRGVNEHKIAAIREYVETKTLENGDVRQVEIREDLKENSGAVSLALRALEEDGLVEDTGRVVGKSKVWRYIGPSSRATVVEPGEGTRSGRRTADKS